MGKTRSEWTEELADVFVFKGHHFVVTPLEEELNLKIIIGRIMDRSSFNFCRLLLFSVVKAV